MKPHKPLLSLVNAEKRIKGRDFNAEPWLIGEGPKYWNPERIAILAAGNEARRKRRAGK